MTFYSNFRQPLHHPKIVFLKCIFVLSPQCCMQLIENNELHVGNTTISVNTHFPTLGVKKLIIKTNNNKRVVGCGAKVNGSHRSRNRAKTGREGKTSLLAC